jgi:hypothetical protein
MRTLSSALSLLAVCVLLTACSTHREGLASEAPPQGAPTLSTTELAAIAMSTLESQAPHINLLSSEALAPLTSAAAIIFKRTGSPRALTLTNQFANDLLDAQFRQSGVAGFFGASTGVEPTAQITAVAGLGLVDAYAATHDLRYRNAAIKAAMDVTSPALGWVASSRGTGVRQEPRAKGLDIAMTANAALLLKRTGELGHPSLLVKARAALRTIYASQAALGRWYATTGTHRPMSLSDWGTTLYVLLADGSKESLGIAGAGIPAFYHLSFNSAGRLMKNQLTENQPVGVALDLRALAASGEGSLADNAFGEIIMLRRRDGTISLAPSADAVGQAYFALAFARRLAGPGPGL